MAPKTYFFQLTPKSYMSGLIYSLKMTRTHPLGASNYKFREGGQKGYWILPGFQVVCHLCWLNNGILNIWTSLLCYYDWTINTILFDLCQSLICNILNALVGCIKLLFGTGGRQKCWFLLSFLVVCYLCWLNNVAININNHQCYVALIELSIQLLIICVWDLISIFFHFRCYHYITFTLTHFIFRLVWIEFLFIFFIGYMLKFNWQFHP